MSETRWKRRLVSATAVRAFIAALPIAASIVTAWAISRALRTPPGLIAGLQWWATVTAPATLVLWLTDRFVRRLLPLSALLRMTMIFPGRAPSRVAVARRAGSTKELRHRLQQARTEPADTDPARAAAAILTLVTALSLHDRRTRGHAERVRIYTDLLGEELRLNPDARDRLRWAALVHDMGKLTVSAKLLNKAGRPSDDEWRILRQHPAEGARLCTALLPWLGDWGRAIIEHHERFDGSGYPQGLSGLDISLAGRVLAVADAYEVMTSARPYKKALTIVEARKELVRCAGGHFDPAIVRAFLNISLTRLRLALGPLSWLAQWPILHRAPQLGPSAGWITASITGAAAMSVSGIGPFQGRQMAPAELAWPATSQLLEDEGGPSVGQDQRRAGSSERSGVDGLRWTAERTPAAPLDELGARAPSEQDEIVMPGTTSPRRQTDPGSGTEPQPDPEPITDTVDPVIEPITDTIDPLVEPITDTIDPLVEPITDTIDPVIEPITDTIDPLVEPITDTIDPLEPISQKVAKPITDLLP